MKKLFLILTVLLISMTSAFAGGNSLNAVILEGTDSGYNIILRSDAMASVKKIAESPDKITLEVKGLTASNSLGTIYKNTSDANSVIVENAGANTLKVHINAKDALNSNVIFDIPGVSPVVVSDTVSKDMLIWSAVAFVILSGLFFMSKNIKEDPNTDIAEALQKDMREREIEMYRNYRKDFLTIPSIDYKIKNPRVQNIIRRADTIRHLQRTAKR